MTGWRGRYWQAGWVLGLALGWAAGLARAEPFPLGEQVVELKPAGTNAPVFLRAVRPNPLTATWNVDVVVSNAGPATLRGPMVLRVESVLGSPGLVGATGTDASGRAFLDVSDRMPGAVFEPGATLRPLTLTLGRSTGVPVVTLSLYSLRPAATPGVARVRSMTADGVPLPGATVTVLGPAALVRATDPRMGLASVAAPEGDVAVRVEAPGTLPVWARFPVAPGQAIVAPVPPLTSRSAGSMASVGPEEARVTAGRATAILAPTTEVSPPPVTLFAFSAADLPAYLPPGWRLMAGAGLLAPGGRAVRMEWRPDLPLAREQVAVLSRWYESGLRWRVVATANGRGDLPLEFPGLTEGVYALVLPDDGPGAPVVGTPGSELMPGTLGAPSAADLTAGGKVTPAVQAASEVAERVTAQASVRFTNRVGALPSGLVFRCEVQEEYRLRDGSRRVPPRYERFIVGRRPGAGAPDGVLEAVFPLRPLLLLRGEELAEALVRVEVVGVGAQAAGLVPVAGAVLSDGGIEVRVADGDVESAQAATLRSRNPGEFAAVVPGGLPVAAAFDLSLPAVRPGRRLAVTFPAQAPGRQWVLARTVVGDGAYGLQPVARLASGADGVVRSIEPSGPAGLAGVDGAGQYLLIEVPSEQGLVEGVARDAAGAGRAGLVVRVGPWLALSGLDGRFHLLAPAGPADLRLLDPRSGDVGLRRVEVPAGLEPVTADVAASAGGPLVLAVSPADGAVNVPRVTPVTLTFSRPLNPATVVGEAVKLVAADGTTVPAGMSLNLARTAVTLLPRESFAALAAVRVQVAATVVDAAGRPVEGGREFGFTTEGDVLRRADATLVIHEPVDGLAPMEGGPGLAEPESPVILVNETTGFTSTVLSKADGSFTNTLPASVEDLLSGVIVNRNGTRNVVPASRQLFRDGRVGLYAGGGTIAVEGPGGRAELVVQAGAIRERAVFRVQPTTTTAVVASANGVQPVGARLLRGLRVQAQGDVPTEGVDVAFTVNPAEFQLPAGERPEDAALGLLVPEAVDGVMAYRMVDKLRYENGRVFSNTKPFSGIGGLVGSMLIDALVDFNVTLALFGGKPVVTSGYAVEPLVSIDELAELFRMPQFQLEALLTGGFLGNLPGMSDTIDSLLQDRRYFKPAAGAFVFARPLATQTARRGRVEAGAVYATVDRDGVYALALPVKVGEAAVPFAPVPGYELVGVHPRYDKRVIEPLSFSEIGVDLGEKPFFRRNIVFAGPLLAGKAPTLDIQAGLQPTSPALGQLGELRAVAFASQAQAELALDVEAVASTVAGAKVEESDVKIENQHTVYLGRGRTEFTAAVSSEKALQAILRVRASVTTPTGVLSNSAVVFVRFGEGEPPLPDILKPAEGERDVTGPGVIRSSLTEGATLPVGTKIVLIFSEPVNRQSVFRANAIRFDPHPLTPPSLFLNAEQTVLEIQPGLFADGVDRVVLSLTSVITDLAGRRFDQATLPGDQSYDLGFRVGKVREKTLAGIDNGGGVVSYRGFLYALDRGPSPRVRIYRQDSVLTGDGSPVATVPLVGAPRDLLVIQDWPHRRSLSDPNVYRSDLLVVVGGNAGSGNVDRDGNVYFPGQYLRVFDLVQPAAPQRILGALITLRNSLITRVAWQPPHLAFLESGSDLQQVMLMDLQSMLIGFNATDTELATFPSDPFPGVDSGQDGSYVQDGDELPLPERRPVEIFGRVASYLLDEPGLIQDVAMAKGFVGVVTTGGREATDPASISKPPAIRVFRSGGVSTPPGTGVLTFGGQARPKRLTVLLDALVMIQGQLQRRSLGLVSMAPDHDGKAKIVLVDLENPLAPSRLPDEIVLPDELGLPQGIVQREDGLLALATATHMVLLDPLRLMEIAPGGVGTAGQASRMHPAVAGIVPNAGSGARTQDHDPSGINLVNLGARRELVLSPPKLSFVIFPTNAGVAQPSALAGDEAAIGRLMAGMRTLTGIPLARLEAKGGAVNTIDPPSPLTHSHVLIEAPGASGPGLTIALESLNAGGYALKDKGQDFAPVRAMSVQALQAVRQDAAATGARDERGIEFRAPVPVLRAHRLGSDPRSRYYNLYLSDPFALIREKISRSRLTSLPTNRPVLFSAHALRAGLDFSEAGNPVIGPFASQLAPAGGQMVPGASVVAETLSTSYIPGDNPPPPGSEVAFPGTFGMVNALNGEVRRTELDVALPGRRLPILFQRTLGGQDLHDGPFGPGWDFFHNQRLVEFKASLFAPGNTAPVVVRQDAARSTITESRDVQWVDGMGHVVLFKHRGTTAPEGVAGDPLCEELGWFTAGGSFYVPDENTKGVFDLLYKFPAGEFCRLTPDGMQFWYAADGRLLRIRHRHPKNLQVLDYNDRGDLVRITDMSVEPPRTLRIGHYRLAGDMQSDIDEETDSAFVAGQVCTLVDPADRKWTFEYAPTGALIRRLAPETDSTAQSSEGKVGFKGRPTTTYLMSGPAGAQFRGVIQGNGANDAGSTNAGRPLFKAKMVEGVSKPVVQEGSGAGGVVGVAVPADNSAEQGAGKAGGTGERATGAKVTYGFNAFGQANLVTRSGPGADDASMGVEYHEDPEMRGLVKRVTGRLGDVMSVEYFNGPLIRSKPNIRRIVHTPDKRGGSPISRSFGGYDLRYNLPTGAAVNENGKTITYQLGEGGREIEQVDFGDGGAVRLGYNPYGQQELEVDPNGVVQRWRYRANDGFLGSQQVGDVETRYAYEGSLPGALGVPSRVILPRGTPVFVTYDARLLPLTRTRSEQGATFAYDENGNRVYEAQVAENGRSREEVRVFTQVSFLSIVRRYGMDSSAGKAGPVQETVYTPDPLFRVAHVRLPEGEEQEFTYDHLHNLRSAKTGDRVIEYAYDLNGNLTKAKLSNDGIIGGLLGSVVEERKYDGHDRLVTVKRPGSGGEETTEVEYHPGSEVLSRRVTDPVLGLVEDFRVPVVDGYGRPRTVIRGSDAGDVSYTINYSAGAGGLTVEHVGPLETVTTRTDTAGRVRTVTDTRGTRRILVNDSFEVEKVESDEDGRTFLTEFGYDELDRRTRISDALGTVAELTPRVDGLPTSSRDALGNRTQLTYSAHGELLRVQREEDLGMSMVLDRNRRQTAVLDPASRGQQQEYKDGRLRLTRQILRSGAVIEHGEPNGFNLPETIKLPGGGSIDYDYDGLGRVRSAVSSFGGSKFSLEDVKYDALGRTRSFRHKTHDELASATFTFDRLGPLKESKYEDAGLSHRVGYGVRSDGHRTHIDYPSGIRVTETRDAGGRLTSISDPAGVIWKAAEFSGADQPVRIERGGILEETRQYDLRRRLVAQKVVRLPDAAVLSDWRYRWDAADNLLVRQAVHEQGRADVFQYDGARRLKQAHFGLRPGTVGAPLPGLAGEEGLQPGFMARTYAYDGGGLDLLSGGTVTDQPETKPWPLAGFPKEISGHDAFLFATTVDGVPRGVTDELGNAREIRHRMADAAGRYVESVATLHHNARNELVRAMREGQEFRFHVRPDHLVHRRSRTSGVAGPAQDRALVWDQGVLLEEHDLAAAPPRLVARYYYAGGDTPVAADLDDGSGILRRYHFLHDHLMSVTAVVDSTGRVVERMHYDAWGQSMVELSDVQPPRVNRVIEEAAGGLLIEFSEPVLPRVVGGTGIRTDAASLDLAVEVRSGGSRVAGQVTIADHVPGLPFGSVLRFAPESAVSGGVEIRIVGGTLLDAWGNANPEEAVPVGLAGRPGIRFAGGGGNSRPALSARSAVGNPFRFQGAYDEPDLGLISMRARWYDPNTGTFLERDPVSYVDSVNAYAGFRNSPVSHRDPRGENTQKTIVTKVMSEATEELSEQAESQFSRRATEILQRPGLDARPAARFDDLGPSARGFSDHGVRRDGSPNSFRKNYPNQRGGELEKEYFNQGATTGGFKMHVTAKPEDVELVVRTVGDILEEFGVDFKVVRDVDEYRRAFGEGLDQQGKLITIYLPGAEDRSRPAGMRLVALLEADSQERLTLLHLKEYGGISPGPKVKHRTKNPKTGRDEYKSDETVLGTTGFISGEWRPPGEF